MRITGVFAICHQLRLNKQKIMKKLQTFDEFLNESFRIDSKDERILGK